MASPNALTTRFAADITQFERELRRLQQLNARAAAQLAAQQARAAQQSANAWNRGFRGMSTQITTLSSQIKQLAPALAGAFSVGAVATASDAYTRFTNQLKVAGVEGVNLRNVQEQLFEIGQKYGVELETLGTLFGRASQSAKELGATQQELLRFTEGVSLALMVQGGSAQSASGALLQLSQALGGGIVRAEEFNSINEGALPILQAVAAGSDRFGGSVANLRKEVVAGKVTSKEFFAAFLEGATILEDKAANAVFTLSQAFTVLSNAFTKYIGEASQLTGATAVLVEAIRMLADNLPTVANALVVIAGIYAASFLPAITRATTAIVANAAATVSLGAVYSTTTRSLLLGATAMSTARTAGMALAGALGGPLGIAITGITVGMAYWAVKTAEANQRSAELATEIDSLVVKLDLEAEAAGKAAAATGGVTQASVVAGAKLRGLAVDVATLTDKYQLLAEAARQAAFDIAQAAVTDAQSRYNKKVSEETRKATPTVVTFGRDPKDRAYGINDGSKVYRDEGKKKAAASQEAKDLAEAKAVVARLRDPKSRQSFVEKPSTSAATTGPAKTKGTGRKGSGSKPSDGEEELRALNIEARQLLLEQVTDLDQRLQLQKDILKLETEGRADAIQKRVASGNLTKAAADQLLEKEKEITLQREANLAEEHRKASIERAAAIAEQDVAIRAERLRQDADAIDMQRDFARTIKAKHDYEWEALEKRQQADRLEFDLRQKQYEAELEKLGLTKAQIRTMVEERKRNFDDRQSAETDDLKNGQDKDDPSVKKQIVAMAEGFGTLDAQLGNIATSGLNSLTRGLADAVMGAGSLQEAFGNMAKSIIADLIQMAIRFVILEAIGMAIGVPGLGKASLGLGSTPKGSAKIGNNAAGTNNWRGGLTMVGEAGPELMYLPTGAQIAPNNLLKTALQQRADFSSTAPVINLHTTVNANDAVLASTVKEWIVESQVRSIDTAMKMTNRNNNRKSRNTLYR